MHAHRQTQSDTSDLYFECTYKNSYIGDETSNCFPRSRFFLWVWFFHFYELITSTVSYRIEWHFKNENTKKIQSNCVWILYGIAHKQLAFNHTIIIMLITSFWKLWILTICSRCLFAAAVYCCLLFIHSFIHLMLIY